MIEINICALEVFKGYSKKKSVYTNKKTIWEMVQFMSKQKGLLNVPDARNKLNNMCQNCPQI